MSGTDTEQADPDGKAKWAPGQMTDGSISILTPDEAAAAIGERDADEEAFNALLGDDGEESLELDLDALSPEELDDLIEGLESGDDPE